MSKGGTGERRPQGVIGKPRYLTFGMTTANRKDRSHESIINDTLARFLRERCGLSAVAETLHGGRRPDIIVRLPEGPVILETELEPALTVEADALSRLGMEIDGQRIQNVFAVTVPGRLRSMSQQHLYERMAGATLAWQEWRIDGTCGPKLSGSAAELGNAVARTTPPVGNLDEAVDALDEGARRAGSRLYSSPGTLGRVSKIFGADPGDEAANIRRDVGGDAPETCTLKGLELACFSSNRSLLLLT